MLRAAEGGQLQSGGQQVAEFNTGFEPALVTDDGHALQVFIEFEAGLEVFPEGAGIDAFGAHYFQQQAGAAVVADLLFHEPIDAVVVSGGELTDNRQAE